MANIGAGLVILDTVATGLRTLIELRELMDRAKMEGRENITLEELESFMSETDKLANEILNTDHDAS